MIKKYFSKVTVKFEININYQFKYNNKNLYEK